MATDAVKMIHMSYAELSVICTSINTFMTRDITEFTTFGTDAADVTAFMTKITAFENLPSDIELAAVLINATAAKNTLAEELRVLLRGLSERARLAYGTTNGNYQLFHSKDLSKLSDAELLTFARTAHRSAVTYATELLAFGFTALMITALQTKIEDMQDAVDDQLTAIAARDIATNNRSAKALELYNMMISYCETGKVIWYGVNDAKYNDYVIFGPSGNLLTLVPPYDFAYDNIAHKFTWSEISNATSYEIQYTDNHVDWLSLWTGSDTEYSYVPTVGHDSEFKCRARNSTGYGDFSDAITILYVDPLPPPASISVTTDNLNPPDIYVDLTWAAVVGATYYKVFESIVNIGQPEGTYSDIGDYTVSNLRKLAPRNHRYYYKVKACNTSTSSNYSTTVDIDVPL